MKKLMIFSSLAVSGLVAGLFSGLAAAQEVGKVISSTPVMRQVTEPGRATEARLIGYKVVYEYAGKQHTVQLPFPPGPTIELEIQPANVPSSPAPSTQVSAPQPLYTPGEVISSSPPQYVSTAPVYVQQPVYVEPAYYSYPPRTYYPSYSYDPIWPLLGVGLAIGAVTHWGWHGGYYRGGYSHVGGHWRR